MPPWLPWIAGLLVLSNLYGFVAIGLDKRAAARTRRRTPEAHLIAPVWLGGVVGVLLGMRAFRHKTAKRSFQLKLLAATLLWGGALATLGYVLATEYP